MTRNAELSPEAIERVRAAFDVESEQDAEPCSEQLNLEQETEGCSLRGSTMASDTPSFGRTTSLQKHVSLGDRSTGRFGQ